MRFLKFLWGLLPRTKYPKCIQCRVPQPLWTSGRIKRDAHGGICKNCMAYKTNLCTSLETKQSIGSGRVVHGTVAMRR